MKKKIITLFVVISLFVLISGCVEQTEEEQTEEETPNTSSTSFYIGDEYADDFKFINITFSEIKLHEKTETDNESWVYLNMEPKTIDLKSLHEQDATALINTVNIEVGNYTKLWINVTNATGVLVENNETVYFTVPSGWLKVQQLQLFNISNGNNTITVYIDLDKSIRYIKGLDEYKLTPVISKIEHKHENEFKFKEHNQSKIKNMVNSPPNIVAYVNDTAVSNNIYLDADLNYTFNASGSYDIDEDNITFDWDFGDETTDNESIVIHKFAYSNKPYSVKLTVTDGKDTSVERFNVHINKETGGQGNSENGQS